MCINYKLIDKLMLIVFFYTAVNLAVRKWFVIKTTKMLKKNYEFKYILTNGKKYFGSQLISYILPNKKNINLLGIAINTKIGNAVDRNYYKRIIRENYKNFEDFISKGYSIVFLLKKSINRNSIKYELIKEDMYNIFKLSQILEMDYNEKNNN